MLCCCCPLVVYHLSTIDIFLCFSYINSQYKFYFQITFGKISHNRLYNMIADPQITAGEDKYGSKTGLKECKASHFSLLIQNLGVLEETFADSDALKLEREILLQLGRLGALRLFNTCLSRTLETSNIPNKSIEEHESSSKMDNHTAKDIVRSRKSRVRKSRERTLEISKIVSSQSFSSETSGQVLQKPTVSSVKRASNSRSRRLAISKKEAEMSIGVKVVFIC